jgi:hypothetical protein
MARSSALGFAGQDYSTSTISSSEMTTVTAGLNTKSVSNLLAPTYDVAGLIVSITIQSVGREVLADIRAAGTTIIPNLLVSASTTAGTSVSVYVPVSVPAGTVLSAAVQASVASTSVRIGVTAIAAGFDGGPPMFDMIDYGPDVSSTTAVSVDPGATANTKGAWSQVTSATTCSHSGLLIATSAAGNYARTTGSWTVDIGIGAAAAETVLIPDLALYGSATDDRVQPPMIGPFPCHIPSGTRLAVRAQSSITDATDRLFDVALYGIT